MEFTLSAAYNESGTKLGAFMYFILNPHSKSFNVLVPHVGNSQSINTFKLETT